MKTIALLGNPNVGKTTLFNSLTGANQRVGNWAGVTVDKKEGSFNDFNIIDLPGIYAMDTYSNEEKVSKDFLENGQVDLILNIIDASNIDRNLYLTMQLKRFKKPIILAVNMIDVAEKKGINIDYDKLSKLLDVTVIPIQASKEEGIDDIKAALEKINYKTIDENDYNFSSEKETYKYIENILDDCTEKVNSTHKSTKEKLDNIMLNPWLAYPIFFAIMALTFQITFSWIGQPLSDLLDTLLNDSLVPLIENLIHGMSPWFQSLILDGIIGGVGGILVLLPIILSLFACITVLEDSGYMARVAFIMDKIMRKMGLSGKAFIPMIVGFGCSVPAIMTARTLESEKDRKLTALLIPLMSCNARLPVYSVFAAVFFPDKIGLIVASLYFLGILLAFILGIIFKHTIFKNEEEPLLIELPEYKLPSLKNLFNQLYEKTKGFLVKAGTLIFAMSIVLWFLSNFNFNGMTDVNNSILSSIGGFIAPIFKPLGFGNWQSSVSLLTGLIAKETVVSSMGVIFAGDLSAMLPLHFTTLSALSFLVFVLLYTPCITVVGTMKKEFGTKITLFSVFYQLSLAWIVSFLVFNIGSLFI
ncbi:ferrous iron transport protein B [Clostridium celatum]|uniref:Ferrous iron transport protein B n=1 Tax=Clostridium celatum DSM 1785 TaxID=545697 RepID=L1QF28_9CLOT|nr:ferrous iron transport protein B [Clostridium celatum]EKY26275.1 ferrous iron transport protein B [Clostridium celatum DSM 1785]MCE9653997.1 ferrous iron transport protein B [Clostridium celatum]MDU2264993.1 ferrous iron transport protein B [Clostridium celatum]MDU3721635.1 ferrous iron transport protein B [Clostridium celatum]MDU6294329.1 ferrous iron transport protein B [Clostridium celatum]